MEKIRLTPTLIQTELSKIESYPLAVKLAIEASVHAKQDPIAAINTAISDKVRQAGEQGLEQSALQFVSMLSTIILSLDNTYGHAQSHTADLILAYSDILITEPALRIGATAFITQYQIAA